MLLAICIPTHHGRGPALRRALDSIAAGVAADERVEVCVSDNASHDETAQVVADFRNRVGDRVRYRRHDENRGFTANLLAAVELAEARWCWLLGSDDLVRSDGVAEAVALVGRHPEAAGATLNRSLVDHRDPAVVTHDHPRLLPADPQSERELHGEREIIAELGQLHDYISTQIVRRELWLAAVARAGTEGLAEGRSYPHLVVIARMIQRCPRWTWHPAELVEQRIGISSVYGDRPDFDVSLYESGLLTDRSAAWGYLFGHGSSLQRTLLRKVWWRHFGLGVLLHHKLDPGFGLTADLRLLRILSRHFWWLPAFWVAFPALLLPGTLMRALRPLMRAAKEHVTSR